jgi:hypothetical protein
MPRDIPVGNGSFLITFDQDYCPSYPGIKGEVLFCARGKSSSPIEKAGCNCGLCDIWNKYELSDFYYCIKGKEK